MTATATFRPASDRAVGFLTTLLRDRVAPERLHVPSLEADIADGSLSSMSCSRYIDLLKAQPWKPRDIGNEDEADNYGEEVTTEGVFELNGEVYRTKKARAGHLYFQIFNFETRKYEYAAGAKSKIRESHRITVERGLELSAQISSCIRCNRTLTATESVERGIGPVCITYFA